MRRLLMYETPLPCSSTQCSCRGCYTPSWRSGDVVHWRIQSYPQKCTGQVYNITVPSSSHPSLADEGCDWPKHTLHNGWTSIQAIEVCFFIQRDVVHWLFMHTIAVTLRKSKKRFYLLWNTLGLKSVCVCVIGASLSEPHTSESNSGIFTYIIYISVVRRSVNASWLF